MDNPVAMRALGALATLLFVTGCALGVYAMRPTVDRPLLALAGHFLAIASLPPWVLSVSWTVHRASESQLSDARLAGYQQCLNQLVFGPEVAKNPGAPLPVVRIAAQRTRRVKRWWRR